MKKYIFPLLAILFAGSTSCNNTPATSENATQPNASTSNTNVGQSGVKDDQSQKNVVQIAIGSKDHSTLVQAVHFACFTV